MISPAPAPSATRPADYDKTPDFRVRVSSRLGTRVRSSSYVARTASLGMLSFRDTPDLTGTVKAERVSFQRMATSANKDGEQSAAVSNHQSLVSRKR